MNQSKLKHNLRHRTTVASCADRGDSRVRVPLPVRVACLVACWFIAPFAAADEDLPKPPPQPALMTNDPEKWRLGLQKPEMAKLLRRGPQGQVIRVQPAEPGEEEYEITVYRDDFTVAEGQHYRIRFQARADAPRPMKVIVNQSEPPFLPIGLIEPVSLTTKWQTFQFDFTAMQTVDRAQLSFHLGGNASPVEFGRIEALHSRNNVRRQWIVVVLESAAATLDFPTEQADSLQLDVTKLGKNPWDVQLVVPNTPVRYGELYALLTRTRAARPFRGDAFFFSAGDKPQRLSPKRVLTAEPEWAWRRLELGVGEPVRQAQLTINAGAHEGLLELGDPALTVVPWHVNATNGASAEIQPHPDPQATRLAIQNTRGNSYDVSLESRGYAADAGDQCTIKIRAKADGKRPAILSLLSRDADSLWQNLGLAAPLTLTPEWQDIEQKFVVQGSADLARVHLYLGDSDVAVEVGPAEVGGLGEARNPAAKSPEDEQREGEAGAGWHPVPADALPADGWRIAASPEAAAETWTAPDRPEVVRVRRADSPDKSASLTALRALPVLRHRQAYVLEYAARSDRTRLIGVELAQDGQQSPTLGLSVRDRLTDQWHTFRHEFVSSDSVETAQLALELGSFPTAVELGAVSLRPRAWRLTQDAESAARLTSSSAAPTGAIVVTSAADLPPHGVQLIRDQLPFRKDTRYRLSFRIRAETPREVGCMLVQTREPGQSLGPHTTLTVGTDWRDFSREFVCPIEDENGGLIFWLGAAKGEVEIAELKLALADGPTDGGEGQLAEGAVSRGRWTLQHRPDRDAQIISSDDQPGMVRVEIIKPGTTRFGIDVYQDLGALEAHRRYVLDFLARADRPRSMSLGVTQSYEPWDALGLYREVELTDRWQAFRFEFSAAGSDQHARLQFNLGVSNAAVEISDVSLKPAVRVAVPYRPNPNLKWFTAGGLAVWGGLMLWAWRRKTHAQPARPASTRGRRRRRTSLSAGE